jgi:hypothetical protein
MARPTNAILWDQWRQRIGRQRISGLSIEEFCRKEQVSSHRFHVWKRRLHETPPARNGTGARVPAPRVLKRRSLAASAPARQHAPGFLQLPVTAVRPSPWIELALPDGTIVRLPQQNLAALTTVLRVLRGEQAERFLGEDGHA